MGRIANGKALVAGGHWHGALGIALGVCFTLVVALEPPQATAHGGHDSGSRDVPAPTLAPGYGRLEYSAPIPGTYRLPSLGKASDGKVLDSEGRSTRLFDVFGDRVVLLSFIYASCSDVNGCPLATAVLHRLKERLSASPDEIVDRLRIVSLSFDPKRDTPAVMRAYGEGFSGPGPEWRFLTTASETDLQPLLDAYGQSLVREVDAEGNDVGRFSHVLRVFLINPAREIRNVYSVSFLHPDSLLSDVQTLLMDEPRVLSKNVVDTRPGLGGSGDDRRGYERSDWHTRSVSLAARRGTPIDLVARTKHAPLGLPPVLVPADNPLTSAKVALGRQLFFDRRLSENGTASCAMCHIPEQGFTSNELATPVGLEGRTVRRNAPSLYNTAYATLLFHDGREASLEAQVWGPLLARNEMGNVSAAAVAQRLATRGDYPELFAAAFPERGVEKETIGMALASYQRTLVSGNSPFDRWLYGGEPDALNAAAQRGFALFSGSAGCVRCHEIGSESALFTDQGFHDTGIGQVGSTPPDRAAKLRVQVEPGRWLEVDRAIIESVSESPASDLGRFEVTGDPTDRFRYRTPSLRNVALTAPYMHDGSLGTLEDVIAYYDRGGTQHAGLDPLLHPLGLSEQSRADLVAFLLALTGADVDELVRDAFAAPIGR